MSILPLQGILTIRFQKVKSFEWSFNICPSVFLKNCVSDIPSTPFEVLGDSSPYDDGLNGEVHPETILSERWRRVEAGAEIHKQGNEIYLKDKLCEVEYFQIQSACEVDWGLGLEITYIRSVYLGAIVWKVAG